MTELLIQSKDWYFRVSNRRTGNRRRSEAQIAKRWVDRWHRRSRDTIADPAPFIAVNSDVSDFFLRNEALFRIRIRRVIDGQDRGLPAVFVVPSSTHIIAIPERTPV